MQRGHRQEGGLLDFLALFPARPFQGRSPWAAEGDGQEGLGTPFSTSTWHEATTEKEATTQECHRCHHHCHHHQHQGR